MEEKGIKSQEAQETRRGSGGSGAKISSKSSSKEKKRKGEGKKEGEGGKRKRGWGMERMGRCCLFILIVGQSLVGVNAASGKAQKRGGQMEGTQGKNENDGSSWVQMNDRRLFQHDKRKCRSGTQKVWSAWDRPGGQTPRRSCGSADRNEVSK